MRHSQTQTVLIGWKSNIAANQVLLFGSARMVTSSHTHRELIHSTLFQLQTLFCDLYQCSH